MDHVAVDAHPAEPGGLRHRLVGNGPDPVRKAVHLHGEADRGGVHGPHALLLERGDDPPGHIVGVVEGVVELEVGH